MIIYYNEYNMYYHFFAVSRKQDAKLKLDDPNAQSLYTRVYDILLTVRNVVICCALSTTSI